MTPFQRCETPETPEFLSHKSGFLPFQRSETPKITEFFKSERHQIFRHRRNRPAPRGLCDGETAAAEKAASGVPPHQGRRQPRRERVHRVPWHAVPCVSGTPLKLVERQTGKSVLANNVQLAAWLVTFFRPSSAPHGLCISEVQLVQGQVQEQRAHQAEGAEG